MAIKSGHGSLTSHHGGGGLPYPYVVGTLCPSPSQQLLCRGWYSQYPQRLLSLCSWLWNPQELSPPTTWGLKGLQKPLERLGDPEQSHSWPAVSSTISQGRCG